MKFSLLHLYLTLLIFSTCACHNTTKIQSTVSAKMPLYQADPTIFYANGLYYLYGTNGSNADSGFKVFTSKDLYNWKRKKEDNGNVLTVNNHTYGSKGFWAPQVFQYKNKFYIAYTANEHIAIAESSSPSGVFIQPTVAPLETSIKQIDPFAFFDTDGKIYLYHVRLQNGNRIFVEALNNDFTIQANTLKECISAADNEQPWENTQHTAWPVTEGPTVIKRKNIYYLFYSANDFRNPDYAVGYATATSPYGPWKKYKNNPIINRNLLSINGTGHGDIVKDKNGNSYYVFHTHYSSEKPTPRRTAIIKLLFAADGSVSADKTTFHYLYTNNY